MVEDLVESALYSDSDKSWDMESLVSGIAYAFRAKVFCAREWLTFCGGSSGRATRWLHELRSRGLVEPIRAGHVCPAEAWYSGEAHKLGLAWWAAVSPPLRECLMQARAVLRIRREFDQSPVTWESSVERAVKLSALVAQGDRKRRVCLLGDDDLTSIALAACDRRVSIAVIDIDQELLAKIAEIADRFGLRIEVHCDDLFDQAHPGDGEFDVVACDPSPNDDAIRMFVQAATCRLSPDGYLLLSALPGNRRPTASVSTCIREAGLEVVGCSPGVVRYDDCWTHRPEAVLESMRMLTPGLDFMFTETSVVARNGPSEPTPPLARGAYMDGRTLPPDWMRGELWRQSINAISGVAS